MFRPKSLHLTNFLTHENTYFEFRQGEAVLVVGQNLDAGGQKSNGSGKSGLNEGISVAITGSSIRDVKTRELILNGKDSATIELVLYNTMYRCELKIVRRLYSSTNKSSECKIWENGVEVISCPDINAYNKFIFDTIGVSKEDFFNFFLITKEQYKPFLSIGDTQKKQIINRFSGADSIDKTEQFISLDYKSKSIECEGKSNEILVNQTKQQVLSEQLQQEEKEQSDSNLEEKKQSLHNKIDEVEKKIVLNNNLIESKKIEISTLQSQIKELPDLKTQLQLDTVRNEIQQLDSILLEKTTEYKNVPSLFQSDIDEIKIIEDDCKVQLKLFNELLLKIKNEKSVLENQLVGLIDCPKCHHQFTLKNKDISVEEVRKLIKFKSDEIQTIEQNIDEYNQLVSDLEPQKLVVNQKITDKRSSLNTDIQLINSNKLKLTQQLSSIEHEESEQNQLISKLNLSIKQLDLQIKGLETQNTYFQSEIQLLNESIVKLDERDTAKIDELKSQITHLINVESVLRQQHEELTTELQKISAWSINFKNFKSYLANQSIKNITDYTNLFLNSIGSNISINIEGYRTLSSGKLKEEITTSVLRDGFEVGSYGKFSAGERGRIDVCCILANQELINLNCSSGGLDLLICDEILDSVDTLGLELIINSLQSLGKTIMIVSQNEINSLASNTITIQKYKGISSIISQ